MSNKVFNGIILALTLVFFLIMTSRYVALAKPGKKDMQNYASLSEYYDEQVCDYAFSQDEDLEYCHRVIDSQNRSQLLAEQTYDCPLLISDEMRADCFWDKAIVQQDSAICSQQLEGRQRDMCFWDVKLRRVASQGESPEIAALCEAIADENVKRLCLGG